MDTNVVFDTHAYVKSMTDAGAEPRLAEAIAQGQIAYLNATAATKTDIANIQRDIEQLRAATKTDIANIQRDIEQLRAATKTDIANIQRDIERSKNDLMKWLVLTMILLDSLLLAAIKLL